MKQARQYSSHNSFDYIIKRQRRKTIAMHVMPDATVEVRVPKWLPQYVIVDFVQRRSDWVIAKRTELLTKLALKPGYQQDQQHCVLGQNYPLQINQGVRASVVLHENSLLIKVRDPNSSEQIRNALEQWYRKQAVELYEQRLFACFETFPQWFQEKYSIPGLTVRKMRRRWGSCSSKGNITLNLSLIKMPISCIDYVISHELCHLEVFNHSKIFYRLLAAVMPDWRERELLIERLG
jgi:predicted metal-dependent hydrolase